MAGIFRKTALAALAILPLSAAAVYIFLVARDTSEIASALLAAAGFLSLASFVQIGLLVRETRALALRQEQTRQQALALARCMRDLNQRMSAVETGENAEPEEEVFVPVAPRAVARPSVPVMAAPEPETSPAEEMRILSLPHRHLAGVEMRTARGGTTPFHAFAGISPMGALIDAAVARLSGRNAPAFVLICADAPLATMTKQVRHLADLAGRNPALRKGLLLGVSQQDIRKGGAAEANELALLARAGLKFALTDISDLRLDAAALAACSISHVRIGARVLMAAGREGEMLPGRLADGGIVVIADGVDSPRLVPELIDSAVALAQGPALDDAMPAKVPLAMAPAPAATPTMPWRAAPSPPLTASMDDSIRYRAAG